MNINWQIYLHGMIFTLCVSQWQKKRFWHSLFTPPNEMCLLIYWCWYDANPDFNAHSHTHTLQYLTCDQNVNIKIFSCVFRSIKFEIVRQQQDARTLFFVLSIFMMTTQNLNLIFSTFYSFLSVARSAYFSSYYCFIFFFVFRFGGIAIALQIFIVTFFDIVWSHSFTVNGRWLINCHNERQ